MDLSDYQIGELCEGHMEDIIIGGNQIDKELKELLTEFEQIRKDEMALRMKDGQFQDKVTKFMKDNFEIEGNVSIMEIIKKVRAVK